MRELVRDAAMGAHPKLRFVDDEVEPSRSRRPVGVERSCTSFGAARGDVGGARINCLASESKRPAPLGFREDRVGPLRQRSFLLSEFRDGVSSGDYFTERPDAWQQRVGDFAAILVRMWGDGIVHRDMKPSNVLVNDDSLTVIDLDSTVRVPSLPRRLQEKDEERLLRKSPIPIELGEALRVARAAVG